MASRKIYSECDIQNQLCYALLDQKLHGLHPLNKSTTEVMQQIHSENHNLPFPAGTAWQHRFSHLVKHVFSTAIENCKMQKLPSKNDFQTCCLQCIFLS